MMDMKSSDKVFKASAFEPTDEEVKGYNRSKKAANLPLIPKSSKSTSPTRATPDELLSESDDDLPDVAQMMEITKKKVNLTNGDVMSLLFSLTRTDGGKN